jgi:glycosyltransferase involved in cell wall biosynthesis
MEKPELSVIIPTYNEEEIIEEALEKISLALGPLSQKTEIIVTDDGTDGLEALVNAKGKNYPFQSVQVLRNNPKLGKGKSVAMGFEKARGSVVGFLDVDLSTPPRYILKAYDLIHSDKIDAFIGSRKAAGATVNRHQFFLKDILGHVLGYIARGIIFAGMRNYQDTQCGFKFYKNSLGKILYRELVAPDGVHDIEVLIRANLMGLRVEECGVDWVDLRESKRPLRRILAGEIVSILKILATYKLRPNTRKEMLFKWKNSSQSQIS